jgi:hypothetical protein
MERELEKRCWLHSHYLAYLTPSLPTLADYLFIIINIKHILTSMRTLIFNSPFHILLVDDVVFQIEPSPFLDAVKSGN